MKTEDSFEARIRAMSEDLNKFRERRLADRRFQAREGGDRRVSQRRVTILEAVTQLANEERRSPSDDKANLH